LERTMDGVRRTKKKRKIVSSAESLSPKESS
jgi:hypothetical protein